MPAADANLGPHSLFVIHKLGFDLREHLDSTFEAPIPPSLARLVDEVDGYADWHETAESSGRRDGPVAPEAQEFLFADRPLL